jgi:hypothetical protein
MYLGEHYRQLIRQTHARVGVGTKLGKGVESGYEAVYAGRRTNYGSTVCLTCMSMSGPQLNRGQMPGAGVLKQVSVLLEDGIHSLRITHSQSGA